LPLLGQSVLLKGVNDTPDVIEALMRALVQARVKPYYLHHPDLAPGTSHLRVDIQTGQRLVRSLRGRVSGLCQPTYVLDIPGGFGKVPIDSHALDDAPDGGLVVEDYRGGRHTYPAAGESERVSAATEGRSGQRREQAPRNR
jgi:lysine 2,3-aminomutase